MGAAMRRMAAAETEGFGPHAGREWLAARLADWLSATNSRKQRQDKKAPHEKNKYANKRSELKTAHAQHGTIR